LKATNKLEEKEIRLCVLVLLEMDNLTIAKTINYAPNGVGKYKYRIAQKLGTTIRELRQFLIEMAIGR
jgi:DNA-binding CsgD family transcriptional regulator